MISGRVVDADTNAPIANVTITTDKGQNTTTNDNGDYSFANLSAGSYSINAAKTDYNFSPANQYATIPPNTTNINFFGTATPQPPDAPTLYNIGT